MANGGRDGMVLYAILVPIGSLSQNTGSLAEYEARPYVIDLKQLNSAVKAYKYSYWLLEYRIPVYFRGKKN